MSLALVVPMLTLFATPGTAATSAASNNSKSTSFGDPTFEQVWSQTDKPVQDKVVERSWMWGPEPFYNSYEPHAESPGGQHMVTYFDKSRMEINDPAVDGNSQWFVTNGLLVVEMISGRMQTGNNLFTPASAAHIPVAGDLVGSPDTPTYASLARVASLKGDNRAPNRSGQPVREGLGRAGNVAIVDDLSGYARYGVYEPTLGHNIADVFWAFMHNRGVTYPNGHYMHDELVVDWLFAMGYPITEPYWVQVKVGGQERWVLVQAFQRRILTFSPDNPAGWKVEMGNVGRAYYDWRYNQQGQPSGPTSTATPTPTRLPAATHTPTPLPKASIMIDPERGGINTHITVYGKYFPAHSAVTISAERSSANYSRTITTVAAQADGSFEVKITLPKDAAHLDEITIAATAMPAPGLLRTAPE
jgi:hypothetical protein